MNSETFINKCKIIVCNYLLENYKECLNEKYFDIYVVWQCKTLQNNKALLSTNATSGLYFEITFNGDKKEFYVDVYNKTKNFVEK